jgi:hypothetical protein
MMVSRPWLAPSLRRRGAMLSVALMAALTLIGAACGGPPAAGPEPTPATVGSEPLRSTQATAAPGTTGTPATATRGAPSTSTPAPGGSFDPVAVLGTRPAGSPVPFGLAIPADGLRAVEDEAGQAVGVIRVFTRWDTEFPTSEQRALLDEGRVLHLSVRPRTEGETDIGWGELAAAEPGSDLYRQMVGWANALARYGPQVYFTFNHEPETQASQGHGSPAEYRAAWRRMVEVLRAEGAGDVRTVLVLGRGAYADGTVGRWYPGDDVVDVVGVDAYNWYDCQGGEIRPWRMPADLLAPAVAFARAHDKPMAVPEIASTEHPDDPLAKGVWMLELARTLAAPALADRVEFAAWFSVEDPAWPACAWRYDSSTSSRRSMAAVVAWLNRP